MLTPEDSYGECPPPLEPEQRRVLHEAVTRACATPTDIRARRSAAIFALGELVEADSWLWCYSFLPQWDIRPRNIDYQNCKRVALHRGIWFALRAYGYPKVPQENVALSDLVRRGEPFTRSIRQLVGPEIWERDKDCRKHVSRLGIDDIVFSLRPMMTVEDRVVFYGVSLGRKNGRPPFTRAQQSMIHEFVGACTAVRAPVPSGGVLEDLGGFTRRYLAAIIGMKEKLTNRQIGLLTATKIDGDPEGLDPKVHYALEKATVKKMTNKIFKTFGVNREELFRRLEGADPAFVQESMRGRLWDESDRGARAIAAAS